MPALAQLKQVVNDMFLYKVKFQKIYKLNVHLIMIAKNLVNLIHAHNIEAYDSKGEYCMIVVLGGREKGIGLLVPLTAD
jgi:hypothetical protein